MSAILANDIRRRELAQIHIAKQQLGMADDSYRSILWTVGRVKSAAELDWAGRKQLLDHFKACGFRVKASKAGRKLASDDWSRKIRALWLELKDRDALTDASEAALAAFVKGRTGVDALDWLKWPQARIVIEQLKQWIARLDRKEAQRAN